MSQGDKVVAWAEAQLGKGYTAYRDCSGFVAAAYRQINEVIPEGSESQKLLGEPVPRGQEQAGDICHWATASGHTGIADGKGGVINALNESAGIVRTPIGGSYGGRFSGCRRVIESGAPEPPKDNPAGGDDVNPWVKILDQVDTLRADVLTNRDAWADPGPDPKPVTPGITFTPRDLAGSTQKLLLPSTIEFIVDLTPKGSNRPGQRMNWTGTTQHETGNERPGADATMHSNWQDAGTPGHPDGNVSVHFYVDDKRIIQKVPVNEQGIHAGDWRNQQHTSVERCVDAGSDFHRSRRLCAYLDAGLLVILGRTAAEALYPHRSKPGAGCPVYLGREWPQFEALVDELRLQIKGAT